MIVINFRLSLYILYNQGDVIMEFNTTIDQLTPEGAKLFTNAVDNAYSLRD